MTKPLNKLQLDHAKQALKAAANRKRHAAFEKLGKAPDADWTQAEKIKMIKDGSAKLLPEDEWPSYSRSATDFFEYPAHPNAAALKAWQAKQATVEKKVQRQYEEAVNQIYFLGAEEALKVIEAFTKET